MLDCWMALTERYTLEFAEALEPYRVYWMEECLPPDNYAGFGRLNAQISSTRMATGEHEYTRYGFQLLLECQGADIWQPDMNWCGGLTELRRIGALPKRPTTIRRYSCTVAVRGGGPHYIMATPQQPLVRDVPAPTRWP